MTRLLNYNSYSFALKMLIRQFQKIRWSKSTVKLFFIKFLNAKLLISNFSSDILFLNIFSIDLILFSESKHFNITREIFKISGIFKIFGKRGDPYMGGLSILWGALKTPQKPCKVNKNKRGLELVTIGSSGYKTSSPKFLYQLYII